MKKITFILLALISGTVFAQNSANAEATTAAEIVAPLKINKERDLNFGRIIGGSAGGGTVSIANTEAGSRTISEALDAPGITPTSAKFAITASGYSYTILMEDTDLKGTDLTTMPFTPENSIGTSSTGDQTLYVGGDLEVGADQEVGTYSGTLTVTVSYQ